jgi:PAS domain-containing protein
MNDLNTFYNNLKIILNQNGDKSVEKICSDYIVNTDSQINDNKFWIWEINNLDELIYVSPGVENILNYSPNEMLSKKIYDFMQDDDKDLFIRELSDIKKKNLADFQIKSIFICKDHHFSILENIGWILFDEKKKFFGYRGISLIPVE